MTRISMALATSIVEDRIREAQRLKLKRAVRERNRELRKQREAIAARARPVEEPEVIIDLRETADEREHEYEREHEHARS